MVDVAAKSTALNWPKGPYFSRAPLDHPPFLEALIRTAQKNGDKSICRDEYLSAVREWNSEHSPPLHHGLVRFSSIAESLDGERFRISVEALTENLKRVHREYNSIAPSPLSSRGHAEFEAVHTAGLGSLPNGKLRAEFLSAVSDGAKLQREAALAFKQLQAEAAHQGVTIRVTSCVDGYRTFKVQQKLKEDSRKGDLGGTPGRSIHGWGLAVDIRDLPGARKWMKEHGWRFGFSQPQWARPDGSKPESWHYEYIGVTKSASKVEKKARGSS